MRRTELPIKALHRSADPVTALAWDAGAPATALQSQGRARYPNVSRRRGITRSANRRAISPRAPSGKYRMK